MEESPKDGVETPQSDAAGDHAGQRRYLHFVLVLAYSLSLKRRVILDVIVIASGFVLRALAGAEAVEVEISPWLVVCTFTVCMFMGFGKRRCELATFANADEAREHRPTLLRYTPELLNHLTSVTAGSAIPAQGGAGW